MNKSAHIFKILFPSILCISIIFADSSMDLPISNRSISPNIKGINPDNIEFVIQSDIDSDDFDQLRHKKEIDPFAMSQIASYGGTFMIGTGITFMGRFFLSKQYKNVLNDRIEFLKKNNLKNINENSQFSFLAPNIDVLDVKDINGKIINKGIHKMMNPHAYTYSVMQSFLNDGKINNDITSLQLTPNMNMRYVHEIVNYIVTPHDSQPKIAQMWNWFFLHYPSNVKLSDLKNLTQFSLALSLGHTSRQINSNNAQKLIDALPETLTNLTINGIDCTKSNAQPIKIDRLTHLQTLNLSHSRWNKSNIYQLTNMIKKLPKSIQSIALQDINLTDHELGIIPSNLQTNADDTENTYQIDLDSITSALLKSNVNYIDISFNDSLSHKSLGHFIHAMIMSKNQNINIKAENNLIDLNTINLFKQNATNALNQFKQKALNELKKDTTDLKDDNDPSKEIEEKK
jgi:hypothetical protein